MPDPKKSGVISFLFNLLSFCQICFSKGTQKLQERDLTETHRDTHRQTEAGFYFRRWVLFPSEKKLVFRSKTQMGICCVLHSQAAARKLMSHN